MEVVATYSKRKPVQRLCENVNGIFEKKGPFTSDSSTVDKTRSNHQQTDQRNASTDQGTGSNKSDTSDQEVFLSLSKSDIAKRKMSDKCIHLSAHKTSKSKHPNTSKRTSKFAEPVLFQDPVSVTSGCNTGRHLRERCLKAGIKQGLRGVCNTIKHVAAGGRCKLPFGRLATRKPIKSPRLQPPRYVNTYRAPGSQSGPVAECEALEGESSQETSDPDSQPIPHSQSEGMEVETSDSTEYTSTYTWTSATGSTDVMVAQYPSIELPRRQAAIQDLFDPFASPVYMERDAKEKDIDQTDVSDLSLFGEDCGKVLNSTLLDNEWAKNIQDVHIMISPIQEYADPPKRTGKSDVRDIPITTPLNLSTEKETKVPCGSAMEMKQRLETTPQAAKTIISPKTPLKAKLFKSKMGKLQPKSSTFIFAEDDQKHMTGYVTVELSEIPKVNDQQKTIESSFSPEFKAIDQAFLTSTPVRGTGGLDKHSKNDFSIDLSTVQAQDSDELQFHTSKLVNSAEIHVSSPEGFTALPDTCVELTHSLDISIPDVEVESLVSIKEYILVTPPVCPALVSRSDQSKKALVSQSDKSKKALVNRSDKSKKALVSRSHKSKKALVIPSHKSKKALVNPSHKSKKTLVSRSDTSKEALVSRSDTSKEAMVSPSNTSKGAFKMTPPVYQPSAYPVCVIVALPEDIAAPKENRILQWHNPSRCSYRTLIKNTPVDIFEALDV
ncbi:hypothetical protein LSAT2_027212 [Lamellibrachia satsuma]|nr:hypothetical protein LSAT2_027212 [Lamellibrachia satsuma]